MYKRQVTSCVLFLLAFVPLIFGGTVYKMLERILTAKLVIVLLVLSAVVIVLVSARSVREVMAGFFRFGQVPLRAATIVQGRHFTLSESIDGVSYTIRGTIEEGGTVITGFRAGDREFKFEEDVPHDL